MKLVSDRYVPHEGPTDAEIFIIGDAPGSNDDNVQKPFSGSHGDLLDIALSEIGLTRGDVRLGNLLNYQPAKNEFRQSHTTWQNKESVTYLKDYLQAKTHKVLVPVGPHALDFLTHHQSIEKHRGSVYKYNGMYVVPTYHPSAVIRDGSLAPAFLHDLAKIHRIAKEGFTAPEDSFNFYPTPDIFQVEALLPTLLSAPRLYCDIESKKYNSYIRCMGFAWSTKDAICIWNDAPSGIGPNFRRVLSVLLESQVPKTFHNGMFDTIMLEENGFTVNNWDYDTMLAQHALQPELPKGLDYCTSMYTDMNYYKDDGKDSTDRLNHHKLAVYNCKDVVATALVQEGQEQEFDDVTRNRANYYMSLVPLAKHFSYTGMLRDPERCQAISDKVNKKLGEDYTVFVGIQMMNNVEPFKVTQHAKVKDFLYNTLGLPVKTAQGGGTTADEDAVISLIATVQKKLQDLKTEAAKQPWLIKLATLKLILRIRGAEKLLSSYVNVETSLDGRVRSWYKLSGTETGRWSAGMWYDQTGLNAQTIPRESV